MTGLDFALGVGVMLAVLALALIPILGARDDGRYAGCDRELPDDDAPE